MAMTMKEHSLFSLIGLVVAVLLNSDKNHFHCHAALVEDHPDAVKSLPGYNQPLPTPWYSGYVSYELEGITVHTHYVLIEAEDNAENEKPLIYWSNGGPGASSLYGLLTELGPLLFSDDSLATEDYHATGIPTPIENPYSWTKLGSLLMFDAPAPVGFSYCNNDTESLKCLSWTDELTSLNTYKALQTFYKEKFPSLQDTPLYLTGESYAGIYVPTLARRILEGGTDIPLKGLAVGDGCLGIETDICGNFGNHIVDYWHFLFLAGHGQIPFSTYYQVLRACHQEGEDSQVCQGAAAKASKQAGGYFEYALYDECIYEDDLFRSSIPPRLRGALNDYPCGGGGVMNQYLEMDVVKEALNVVGKFFIADNGVGFDYTTTEPDLRGFYKKINSKLRVLIYNGDTDPAITSFAAQNWTSHMGFPVVQEWRPWTLDFCRAVGGYVTRYGGDFDFVTIRGAGHMVPTYKPAATFAFIKAWIEGTDYPAYDKDCQHPAVARRGDQLHTETS